MILFGAVVWLLTVAESDSNFLNIDDIRLVNGTGPFGGRVEISINGIWGTVCDDSFDMNDAAVMCRMMNLKASAFVTGAWFGQGLGPIFAQEFECRGYETHLRDCPFVSNVQCTNERDVGIICSECGKIEINNGHASSISANGTELSVVCNNNFKTNVTTSICENEVWTMPSVTCVYDITDIRLTDGIGLYDGRIELLVNGTWGTVCATSFSWPEARAICNILFGTTWYRTYHSANPSYYGVKTGPIFIDNLDCDGSENDINECSYSLDVSCTSHSSDAVVACNVLPLNVTDTRLVNGTGPYDGRVEFFVDGHWGTICNRYVDMYDAQAICNTHNASLATYFDTALYGEGSGPVLIGYISCGSGRDHVNECSYYSPFRSSCRHNYDLSIACTPCGLPDIYNGAPFSFNNTELTVKCYTGFFPYYIKMTCLSNGSWAEDGRCTSYDDYPLNIHESRLISSYVPTEGRVELLVNDIWGTICDNNFDLQDATVICKMFGLQYSGHYVKARGFGRGTGPIYIDVLDCNGTETHINECSYNISNTCTHYDDVGVICSGINLN
ncbi:deleted in malignant brain tumors 1 protein-like [Mercenaria mercenaria]|uniref:deleted in malignant brain tumors 1 protein-like n=1 Tax=Mercenaria mercenaria TaxID=6596 RepID=UPI00234EB3EC|nr:deleted in malignant brain tumors 1 protein-like [Mercenaria mercenaria]